MSAPDITRWLVAGLLGAFWLLCAASNLVSLIGAANRKGSTSLTLFIGGVAGALSLVVCPVPGTARWAWLPPLLDVGSVWAVVAMGREYFTRGRSSDHDDPA